MLAHYDTSQKLGMCYLSRRKATVLTSFRAFGLRETGKRMGYESVPSGAKNEIELMVNFTCS